MKNKPYKIMLPIAAVLPAVPAMASVTMVGYPECEYVYSQGCTSINEQPQQPEGCDGMTNVCASGGSPAVYPSGGDVHFCCC